MLSFESIDPAVHPDPDACATWATLRAKRPVAWVVPTAERPGFWVLTKYEDIAAAYRTPTLSSAQGNMLSTLTTGGDPSAGRMLVVMDPPRHTQLRRILQGGFSQAMRPIEHSLRVAADSLVSRAVEREGCDFAAEVAAEIPLLAVCELLGVPQSDRQQMLDMTMAVMGDDGTGVSSESAAAARREILMYYAQLLVQRRRAPAEDIVSLLAAAHVGGEPLSDAEVILNCYNIIIGGDETGRLSAVGGLLALIENPAEWAKLKSSESMVDDAVQEILRWTTPATHMCRVATRDMPIRDSLIASGDIVTLWNVSANRDEDVFDQPYVFDISRTPNKHLTFGAGPHSCLGGRVAKVVLTVVLQALRERVSSMELAGEPRRMNTTFLAGISKLPVRLSA